ncbi:YbaB/EbfC family nucleoid-associated protein [Sphaerisporangium aureirubrum]|uniref:YbaB/EbfC family nucleoid-associated protein n=1 Tax=Sphaerisporangium aureirubrum TaxID=1544736 RepID=A0ABW1NUZ6_9ACTN
MFDPARLGPDDFARVAEESMESVRRLGDALGGLAGLKGEGAAGGGLVGAVVDAGGRLEGVTLDPRALRMDSRSLAEAITEAVRAAQDDARARADALLGAPDVPALDGMLAWLEETARAMGETPYDDRPPGR